MKTRESGMPDELLWQTFFDPPRILERLGLTAEAGDVVDFGCGYGTFALAAARITRGRVHAIDVDSAMIDATRAAATETELANVDVMQRDFVAHGAGLPDASCGFVMLFNILHAAERDQLLREALRVLRPGGLLGIIHWRCDPTTPRGPSMSIRPQPQTLRDAALAVGFEPDEPQVIDLPPYHYGLTFRRP